MALLSQNQILKLAQTINVDPKLVAAFCIDESALKNITYRYDINKIFNDYNISNSWQLMMHLTNSYHAVEKIFIITPDDEQNIPQIFFDRLAWLNNHGHINDRDLLAIYYKYEQKFQHDLNSFINPVFKTSKIVKISIAGIYPYNLEQKKKDYQHFFSAINSFLNSNRSLQEIEFMSSGMSSVSDIVEDEEIKQLISQIHAKLSRNKSIIKVRPLFSEPESYLRLLAPDMCQNLLFGFLESEAHYNTLAPYLAHKINYEYIRLEMDRKYAGFIKEFAELCSRNTLITEHAISSIMIKHKEDLIVFSLTNKPQLNLDCPLNDLIKEIVILCKLDWQKIVGTVKSYTMIEQNITRLKTKKDDHNKISACQDLLKLFDDDNLKQNSVGAWYQRYKEDIDQHRHLVHFYGREPRTLKLFKDVCTLLKLDFSKMDQPSAASAAKPAVMHS